MIDPLLLAQAVGQSVDKLGPGLSLVGTGIGAGIGVGLVGAKAAEAVGRNPGAFGSILTISIIGMALAEAVAIYGLIAFFTLAGK
jgi:F-type H+-transporting ATPase subunit c